MQFLFHDNARFTRTLNYTYTDLDKLEENYCKKIESATSATQDLILNIKLSLAEKIQKLVDTVQYEMKHSKHQLNLLRANTFF